MCLMQIKPKWVFPAQKCVCMEEETNEKSLWVDFLQKRWQDKRVNIEPHLQGISWGCQWPSN